MFGGDGGLVETCGGFWGGLVIREGEGGEPRGEGAVEVVAAEGSVAVGGEDLEDPAGDFEDGDIERAAAEVEDGDAGVVVGFVEAEGEGCGGGFVEDAFDGEACEFAGLAGGGALGVVEVGGDGDDGAVDGAFEGAFGDGFEATEDDGGDFDWGEELVVEGDGGVAGGVAADWEGGDVFEFAGAAADEAFDAGDGASGGGGAATEGRTTGFRG